VLLDRQPRRSKSGRNLAVQTSQLQSVALYGPRVTSPLLSHLVKGLGCEQLRHVDVESKQISDAALEQLCRCVSLQTLALHCIKLTDGSLAAISRACPNLTKVDLSGCSRVRDDGILAIAANCPTLQKVDLTMCRRVTDRSVVALAQHSSLTLEEVVLDRCLKVRTCCSAPLDGSGLTGGCPPIDFRTCASLPHSNAAQPPVAVVRALPQDPRW
jgi:hypothetical protein